MGFISGAWLWKLGVGLSTIMAGFLATASDSVSLVGSAGFTAFALTGFGLMWRSWRKELNRLSFNFTKKERQVIILVNACILNGVVIPEEFHTLEYATKPEELEL